MIIDNIRCKIYPKTNEQYYLGQITSWSQSMTALSIILSELILLIIKLLYSALESILLTLIPPSEKSLEGEIILLTGAGNGIGRELAKQFVQHKVTLVCWDIDEKGNNETKQMLEEQGYKNIHTYKLDVSNREEVLRVADKVRKEVGEVTILVNNAGIMPCKPLNEQKPDVIRKTFDVNVLAHFWVSNLNG
ncbi:hypothetical protein M8J77_019005 [Diaphorina citri]|nr:hypothetical protein M8J77_019005 [Diaphorina citri]